MGLSGISLVIKLVRGLEQVEKFQVARSSAPRISGLVGSALAQCEPTSTTSNEAPIFKSAHGRND